MVESNAKFDLVPAMVPTIVPEQNATVLYLQIQICIYSALVPSTMYFSGCEGGIARFSVVGTFGLQVLQGFDARGKFVTSYPACNQCNVI